MKVRNIRASTSETPYKHSAVGLNLAACAGTKLVHFSSEAQGATFVFSGFVNGGEGGIRFASDLILPATYRLHVAEGAVSAIFCRDSLPDIARWTAQETRRAPDVARLCVSPGLKQSQSHLFLSPIAV